MTDRDELTQRIEDVLIEHTFVPGDDEVAGECTGATCTWHRHFLGDWRKHVAEQIVAALPIHVEPPGARTTIDTLYSVLEDAIWQALDSEQGMPHSGVDPAYVIPEFLRLLDESGYTVISKKMLAAWMRR